jgi:hypothetical protein
VGIKRARGSVLAIFGARSCGLRCQQICLLLFLHKSVFLLSAGPGSESGYFGPWQICKYLLYSRERCGPSVTRFKPIGEYAPSYTAVSLDCRSLIQICRHGCSISVRFFSQAVANIPTGLVRSTDFFSEM